MGQRKLDGSKRKDIFVDHMIWTFEVRVAV